DGYSFYEISTDGIIEVNALDERKKRIFIPAADLTPKNQKPLKIARFTLSDDKGKVLLHTNTQKVWRYDTRGDYWVFDIKKRTLSQIGKNQPGSSLMFAKFSPDARRVAYVSKNNIYVEDLATGTTVALTTDGTDKLINGTFDWAYEEEFGCRDGFRWSAD